MLRPRAIVFTVLFFLLALLLTAVRLPAQTPQRYLYVAAPSDETDPDLSIRLLVFDIEKAHRFVKRVVLWRGTGRDERETVRGIAANPKTGRLFVSTTRRLAAIDLNTDATVWEKSYEGRCCDRFALSPDGQTIYAPAFGSPKWYVVDAATGELRATVAGVQGWPRDTVYAPDGRRVYLAAWESTTISVVDTASRGLVKTVGPFSGFVCPVTLNGKGTLAFANIDGLVGFEVADLQTGQILDSVGVEGIDHAAVTQYECPSHGIAFTRNERELWVVDGVRNRLHVFDATVYPPAAVTVVDVPAQPRWITFGLDGRYAYVSTGDIVDVAMKKIVGVLEDEAGVKVSSEQIVDVIQ
jgi:YVTN family beta-propeller protein